MIQQEHHLRINLQLLGLFHEDASLPKSSPLGNLHSKKTFPIFNTKYIFKRSIFLLPSTKRYCRFGTLSAKKLHQSKHTTTKNNIVLFFVKILNDELFSSKSLKRIQNRGNPRPLGETSRSSLLDTEVDQGWTVEGQSVVGVSLVDL